MKYNLTNETYLPETVRNFPRAPEMTLGSILTATFMLSILPLALSALTYYFIYEGVKKLFGRTTILSMVTTGIILTSTTPLLYIIANGYTFFRSQAETLAWVLCFIFSLTTYLLLNKRTLKKEIETADNKQ
jgi:hypothetical protein